MNQGGCNWGIIGCGKIAHSFAESLEVLPKANLYAVASRSHNKAKAFGKLFGADKYYNNYQSLLEDEAIDIVYIATPHSSHVDLSLRALKHKKSVLCEKPMSLNAADAQLVFNLAEKNQLFFMEAMWMYFLPAIKRVKEIIDDGVIGEIKLLQADFCFNKKFDSNSRLFDLALGGGSLLDVGVYPIALSYLLMEEEPVEVFSTVHLGASGVDEHAAYLFKYTNGAIAQLSSGISINTQKNARIYGDKGYVEIFDFWKSEEFSVHFNDQTVETYSLPYVSKGMQFEALEAMTCMHEGRIQSSIMGSTQSMWVLAMMDKIRNQWGLKYPSEN